MQNTLLVAGLACLIAAVVGGGLKAFGVEIPVLASVRRQLALGVLGLLLVVLVIRPFSAASNIHHNDLPPRNETTVQDSKQEPPQAKPTGTISVNVNSAPRTVEPGGSTQITVFTTASDGSILPGTQVVVSAGGGAFSQTGATKVVGTTDDTGVFRTTWRTNEASAYTGDMSYKMSVKATKGGYEGGDGSIQVFIHR